MTLRSGESIKIAWTTSGIPADASMRILLKSPKDGLLAQLSSWLADDSSVDVATVAADTPNSGALTWTVPLSVAADRKYFVQVIWTASGLRANSLIVPSAAGSRAVLVTLPRTDLVWYLSGTKKTVEWSVTGFAGDAAFDVALYAMRDGVATLVAPLTTGASAGGGQARVYVALPASARAGLHFVRVTSREMPLLFADSTPFFVAPSESSGVYQGADANALDRDYDVAAAPSRPLTWGVAMLILWSSIVAIDLKIL